MSMRLGFMRPESHPIGLVSEINPSQALGRERLAVVRRWMIPLGPAGGRDGEVYKTELINRLYFSYEGESISSELRGNIEFCSPILWKGLPREDKTHIGKRFEKTVPTGDSARIASGQAFMRHVGGMMYVSSATRRILIEPIVESLTLALDNWNA